MFTRIFTSKQLLKMASFTVELKFTKATNLRQIIPRTLAPSTIKRVGSLKDTISRSTKEYNYLGVASAGLKCALKLIYKLLRDLIRRVNGIRLQLFIHLDFQWVDIISSVSLFANEATKCIKE